MKRLAWQVAALALVAATSAAATGRLADVTVIDRTSGRALPMYWHEGHGYVVGTPGHEYSLSVRNRQGEDVLAVASVDGVNVISGDSASASQVGYVVDAGGRLDIKGWRKSVGETASFYFTSLGDSYAARTDRPDNVGVIGVALFERARRLPPPPMAQSLQRDDVAPARDAGSREERAKSSASASASAPAPATPSAPGEPLGTGHGRREASRIHYVEFERATAQPAETVVIRYDSYRNLVAMGVIAAYGRREPSPFPGPFVPDPR